MLSLRMLSLLGIIVAGGVIARGARDDARAAGKDTVNLAGTTTSCVIGEPAGPTPPMVTPRLFYSDQPTQLTVTSVVPPDPNLIAGGVTLLQVDSSGNLIANLGQLYDDGTHGDAQAGDGMYTAQPTVNIASAGQIYLAVKASYSGPPGCRQSNNNEAKTYVVGPVPSSSEMNAELNVMTAATAFENNELSRGVSMTQLGQDLINYLQTSFPSTIASAQFNQYGDGIGITFKSGRTADIMLTDTGR